MTDDILARHLHDKATRDGSLTEEEQAYLNAWYARQDQEEMALLAPSTKQSLTLTALREEVENALIRLQTVTQQIQAQEDSNETLRHEVAALSQQLAQTKIPQAA